MIGYVYILRNLTNRRHYIGSTNNIERRISEHNRGKSVYTRNTGPYELVFQQKYKTLKEARRAELWIKKQKDSRFIDRIVLEGLTKEFE